MLEELFEVHIIDEVDDIWRYGATLDTHEKALEYGKDVLKEGQAFKITKLYTLKD